MIGLINGAFGVGKTTLARLLVERLPGSVLYNPERVGSALRATVGWVIRLDDYQDLPLWCPLVVGGARVLYRVRSRHLVIPMTLWRRRYFDAITTGLRRLSPEVVCLRLTASERELRGRILGRADAEGGHDWCLGHLEGCMAAFSDLHFGIEIATDGKTPGMLATEVMGYLPPIAGAR